MRQQIIFTLILVLAVVAQFKFNYAQGNSPREIATQGETSCPVVRVDSVTGNYFVYLASGTGDENSACTKAFIKCREAIKNTNNKSNESSETCLRASIE